MFQLSILLSILTVARSIRPYMPPSASTIRNSLKDADPKLSSEVDNQLVDTLADGLSAGLQITEALEKGFTTLKTLDSTLSFAMQAAEMAEQASMVFGALSAFVSLKDMFVKSAEEQKLDHIIQMLTDGFKQINQRFDGLAHKLSDIEKVIKTEHVWTRISPVLQGLDIVNQYVSNYFDFPSDIRKQELLDQYNDAYEDVIVLRNEITVYALCDTMTDLTSVDRRKVMHIVLDLFGRLVRGTSDVVLIAKLSDRSDFSRIETDMKKWLNEASTSIDDCDEAITTKLWMKQWKIDLGRVDVHKRASKYAQNILNELSKKYYWRNWFVVVYEKMSKNVNHYVKYCGSSFNIDRFRVIVSSSPGNRAEKHKDLFQAYKKRMIRTLLPKSNDARKIWKKLPKIYIPHGRGGDCNIPMQIKAVVRKYGGKGFSMKMTKGAGQSFSLTHHVKKRHGFRKRRHTFRVFIMGGV